MPDNNIPADHPMNEIARQFRAPAESVAESPDADSDAPLDGDAPSSTDPTASPETQPEAPLLSLMPGQIGAPAFFVDRRLMVRWVAPGRADTLSSALHEELRADSERNIFSLLQRSSVKAAVKDWSTLFSFAYVVLRRSTAKDLFDSGTAVIDRRQRFRLDDQRQADSDDRSFVLESRLLENDAPSGQAPLRIFGVGLKEGTLFVLRQDPWCDPDADPPGARRPAQATFDEPDLKACVCILSVRLDDSHRISDTMLPEIFFRLMHIVWEAVDDVAAALGGRRIGSDGVHNPYLFKAGAGRHPVFSAMCCAARINGRLSSLAPRIADDLGWVDEVCMNMGISQGQAARGQAEPDGGLALRIPGGPFDQASLLSAIAGKGDVWVTKNAVAQLPRQLIDQVVVGVERKGQFRRNLFTRIEDMPVEKLPDQPRPDLGSLAIARIMEIAQH